MQCREDVERVAPQLTTRELWVEPGGAASVGFHLSHIVGSLDRLLTYARGAQLDDAQLAALAAERAPGEPPADATVLAARAVSAIRHAIDVIADTPVETLEEPRSVGRARLPSTVGGLLFHVAEHTQRHVGQVVTTAKVVRGLGLGR